MRWEAVERDPKQEDEHARHGRQPSTVPIELRVLLAKNPERRRRSEEPQSIQPLESRRSGARKHTCREHRQKRQEIRSRRIFSHHASWRRERSAALRGEVGHAPGNHANSERGYVEE